MRRFAACAAALGLAAAGGARAQISDAGCPGHLAAAVAEATFYSDVASNACGLPVAPGEYVAAVGPDTFAGSAICGRCLHVTGPLGDAIVRVTDLCPECPAGDLDLGADAFAAIADPVDGRVPIAWESVGCPVPGPIAFFFSAASSHYYAEVQIRDARYPLAALEVQSGAAWADLPRSTYGFFTIDSSQVPVPFDSNFTFRLTDAHGATLVETGIPYAADTLAPGQDQLPVCPEPGEGIEALAAAAALAVLGRERSGVSARPR